MRRLALLPFAAPLLAGCDGEAPPATTAGFGAGWDTASAWTLHEPELDAGDVATRLESALANGLPDSPALMASLDALIAQGETGTCGGGGRNMQFPMAGCETASGWVMGGWLVYESDGGGNYTAEGDVFAVDPDGNRWIGAGYLEYTLRNADDWRFEVSGTWGYAHDVGWPGAQPSLSMTLDQSADGTTLEGGYQPFDDAVYFSGVTVDAAGAASGTVSLRDPLGDWYALALGPGGCGEVSWGDDALGEACVDLAGAVDGLRERARNPQ